MGHRSRRAAPPPYAWPARPALYEYCVGAGGPRGCQAHPNQGVVKYHTLRLPDPNSSVNFSDEPDERDELG